MITKSRVKREIDRLPNELLEKVYKYISQLSKSEKKEKKLPSFKLKGQFDKLDIRKAAYE